MTRAVGVLPPLKASTQLPVQRNTAGESGNFALSQRPLVSCYFFVSFPNLLLFSLQTSTQILFSVFFVTLCFYFYFFLNLFFFFFLTIPYIRVLLNLYLHISSLNNYVFSLFLPFFIYLYFYICLAFFYNNLYFIYIPFILHLSYSLSLLYKSTLTIIYSYFVLISSFL